MPALSLVIPFIHGSTLTLSGDGPDREARTVFPPALHLPPLVSRPDPDKDLSLCPEFGLPQTPAFADYLWRTHDIIHLWLADFLDLPTSPTLAAVAAAHAHGQHEPLPEMTFFHEEDAVKCLQGNTVSSYPHNVDKLQDFLRDMSFVHNRNMMEQAVALDAACTKWLRACHLLPDLPKS